MVATTTTPPLIQPTEQLPKPWFPLSISRGDLRIADTKNYFRAMSHTVPGHSHFAFLRTPRLPTLQMTKWNNPSSCNEFMSALDSAGLCQKQSLTRGKDKIIFGSHKYTCLGVQPMRAKAEVSQFSHHALKMDPNMWNILVNNAKSIESVAASFIPTQELSRIHHAKNLNNYPCLQEHFASNINTPPYQCKMYGALALGLNVHLSCHCDQDFTYSMAIALKKDHTCAPKDDIIAYFCFPTIATAVAMRPGDIVIFDPTIPHCISSRCNNSHNIYCISLYLKSLVVGLNDNKLALTPAQSALSSQFTHLNNSHSSK